MGEAKFRLFVRELIALRTRRPCDRVKAARRDAIETPCTRIIDYPAAERSFGGGLDQKSFSMMSTGGLRPFPPPRLDHGGSHVTIGDTLGKRIRTD